MASRKRRDKPRKNTLRKAASPKKKADQQKEEENARARVEKPVEGTAEVRADWESEATEEEEMEKEETSSHSQAEESSTEQDDTDGASPKEAKGLALSLDVLAMVASETLEKEPVNYGANKKLTLRNIQSMEVLSLEQIRLLSDKALVNMFADMNSNELKRNYSFTCFLLPNKCSAHFSSFGNEHRARQSVCAHLRDHIKKIMADDELRAEFTAEPIHARKRRLTAVKAKATKTAKKKKVLPSSKAQLYQKPSKLDKYTLLKPSQSKDLLVIPKGQILLSEFMSHREMKLKQKDKVEEVSRSKPVKLGSPTKKNIAKKFATKKSSKEDRKLSSDKDYDGSTSDSQELIDVEGDDGQEPRLAIGKEVDTDKCIAVNDQFIIDLLSRSQPHHDHCYTTIFGKRRGAEMMHYEIESSSDESEDEESCSRTNAQKFNKHRYTTPQFKSLAIKVTHGTVKSGNNMSVPVIQYGAQYGKLSFAPDGTCTPIVGAQEEVQDFNSNTVPESSSSLRPYPPMPKFDLAKKGKIFVPEEMLSSGDEAERLIEHLAKKKAKSKLREGSAEWEKKTALRCIRELRTRKKDDRVPLICKICKDKTFTAAATLMYHYRSHAGIKPFVCLICNTTFTRQHSLNYHMLIHNNQSRFTCPDCDKKFRHPSHFKEHIRRHTGETPFVCTDCPLRFKTRNTYKRHLKTRHGKLLTASGIHNMTAEDFRRFQTKPYKKRVEIAPGGRTIVEDEEKTALANVANMMNIVAPVSTPMDISGSDVIGGATTKTVLITPGGQVSVIEASALGILNIQAQGMVPQGMVANLEATGGSVVGDENQSGDEDIDDGFSDISLDDFDEEDDELLDIT